MYFYIRLLVPLYVCICTFMKEATSKYIHHTPSLQALLLAISNAGGREDIIEPAICALRHITSRHPNADMAQNSVRHVGGIPVVTAFLHQQCRWPLLKVNNDEHFVLWICTMPLCIHDTCLSG